MSPPLPYAPNAIATHPTPGPWTAWDDDGTGTFPCVLAEQVTPFGNFYIAQCNNMADARLIAALPALMDFVCSLRDHGHEIPMEHWQREADALIRSATDAQPEPLPSSGP